MRLRSGLSALVSKTQLEARRKELRALGRRKFEEFRLNAWRASLPCGENVFPISQGRFALPCSHQMQPDGLKNSWM